jgi:hypothetical protein
MPRPASPQAKGLEDLREMHRPSQRSHAWGAPGDSVCADGAFGNLGSTFLHHGQERNPMSPTLTKRDLKFLRAVGIDPKSMRDKSVRVKHPDSTVLMLRGLGIPVTRENWLHLQFMGRWPEWAKDCITEPLPEDLEDELPKELRIGEDDEEESDPETISNAPSAGWAEPSYTTPSGFPICETCGKSTRNRNEIRCAPCRNGTRLVLTKEDRKRLREMGIKP